MSMRIGKRFTFEAAHRLAGCRTATSAAASTAIPTPSRSC